MEPIIGEADFDQIMKYFNKISNHAEYPESTEYGVMRANDKESDLSGKGKERG